MRALLIGDEDSTIFVSAAMAWKIATKHHRDPFDRMLIAQAIVEDCMLISNERVFDMYNVPRLW